MISGIEHTAIASPDPQKLAQWYVDHLGFVVNFRSTTNRTVFIRAADGSMIEIIEATAPLTGVSGMRDPGLRHVALTVTDLDAEYQRLRAAGVSFLTAPDTIAGNTLAFFRDGDGNILHLLHRETPLP
jgi:glyoxylase I family protein